MVQKWIQAREKLFFRSTPGNYAENMQAFRDACERDFRAASGQEQDETAGLLKEITIDIPSFLIEWNPQFKAMGRKDKDTLAAIQTEENIALLRRLGREGLIPEIQRAIGAIRDSSLHQLARKTLEGALSNYWGNDGASGIMEAMRTGASLVTTNPPIINIEKNAHPEKWARVRDAIRREHPEMSPVELAQRFTALVVLENCEQLRSVYDATDGAHGYVCYQVNPFMRDDAEAMYREAKDTYLFLKERLGGEPNVLFKLPGSNAAIESAGKLTAEGIGVTITGSYAVAQHLAFAEAIERGKAKLSYLVMMSGRLDTPVAEELEQAGVPDAAALARNASAAVLSKSYDLLNGKGYRKSCLLIASLRGPWNIIAGLTDEKQPIHVSVFPNRIEEFDSQPRDLSPAIRREVPAEAFDVLVKSRIFRQAYYPEQLPASEFDAFIPFRNTLEGFENDYRALMDFLQDSAIGG